MKIVKQLQPKIVIFTAVKNRCMLHGRVFVMDATVETLFWYTLFYRGDFDVIPTRCYLEN